MVVEMVGVVTDLDVIDLEGRGKLKEVDCEVKVQNLFCVFTLHELTEEQQRTAVAKENLEWHHHNPHPNTTPYVLACPARAVFSYIKQQARSKLF